MHWPRRPNSGISLVEVLVVIAIIAILAGILFPVFTTAKVQGKKAKCASNLRQLGRAFQLYLSDWNAVYPAPGGRRGDYTYWAQSGRGGLVGYVGRNGGVGTVWCCPELTKWNGSYEARTYSMNSYLRRTPDVPYSACLALAFQYGIPEILIEVPGKTILLYEGMPIIAGWSAWTDAENYIYRCGNWQCVRGWFTEKQPRLHTEYSWLPWHGKQNNYLYIDGHIVSRAPSQYKGSQLAPHEERIEWWVRKATMEEKLKGW